MQFGAAPILRIELWLRGRHQRQLVTNGFNYHQRVRRAELRLWQERQPQLRKPSQIQDVDQRRAVGQELLFRTSRLIIFAIFGSLAIFDIFGSLAIFGASPQSRTHSFVFVGDELICKGLAAHLAPANNSPFFESGRVRQRMRQRLRQRLRQRMRQREPTSNAEMFKAVGVHF